MGDIKFSLLLTLSVVLRSATQPPPPYCTKYVNTVLPVDPPFPQFDSPTYQTRIEANLNGHKATVSAQEYFDSENNRATLIMSQKGGQPITMVFDYAVNQLFYIKDGLCATSVLLNDTNSFLFGNEEIGKNPPHTFTTNGALHFMKANGQKYMGNTVVRGIDVDWWQSCVTWPILQANFVLDYYFSTQKWSTYSGYSQVPVRAVATGQADNNDGTVHKFNHTYEYFDFRLDITEDDEIFETPRGVVCPNRINTKALPSLDTSYHYRQEIVIPSMGTVQMADIYYDHEYKLVRFDYSNISPVPPTYSVSPLSEIHDFNTGVRYLKDLSSGNCSVYPISSSSFDDYEATGGSFANNSVQGGPVLHMKNPLQFLSFGSNFTYTGNRKARGALCDVYTGVSYDYVFRGQIRNATFEYYFLSKSLSDYTDDNSGKPKSVPYQLIVTVLTEQGELDTEIYYNFLDFSIGHPDISVFDVSTCYSSAADLQFQVRFPGPFRKSNEDFMKHKAQSLLATTMNVSFIRVQDLRLDYDNSNVYISATLLDRTPPAAQFNFIAASEIQSHDDLVYDGVKDPQKCASYCVNNPDFVCNSFDFCGALSKGNCRMSKSHIGDGTAKLINSTCDHFSRNINGPTVQETPIDVAFDNLRQKVYSKQLRLQIYDFSNGGTFTDYYAVDARILFGWLNQVSLPPLNGQFSYNLEIVVPSIQQVYTSNIWYDLNYKLVRYDLVNPNPVPPLYDPNPMTFIHDFNTGLAYNIDRTQGNCTINAISDATFDATQDTAFQNGAHVIMMKNPLELFTLNETYKWAGQKTVRGMICDVFETTTRDFKIASIDRPVTSKLQFYFLSDAWAQLSSTGSQPVNNQPIRLDVSVDEVGFFITYNYYNFNEEDPDLSNFDITPCFSGINQRHFAIVFYDQYHPVLDTHSKEFMAQARRLMAQSTLSSSLRFQNFQLTYDNSRVSLIGTIVEQAPFIDDFTMVPAKAYANQKNTVTYQKIQTAAACATMCRKLNNISCEGFDYCAATQTCILSAAHADTIGTVVSKTCNHYSRTIHSLNSIQPTIDGILITLNDIVYKKLFSITIKTGQKTQKTYTASKIRDDIVRNEGQRFSSSGVLSLFNLTQNSVIYLHNDGYKAGLSVDQCARACLLEMRFDCQSFDYCYSKGDCLLSKTHPDDVPNSVQQHDFCDMYSRTYLFGFNAEPGLTFSVPADYTQASVSSENQCAKICQRFKTFQCKSFQYCPGTSQCSLFKTHRLDMPKSSANLQGACSFFSRKYINDFQLMGRQTIQFSQFMDFKNVTPSECAKLCVDLEAFNCKSFAYCGNDTLCRLTPAHPRLGNNVTHSATCDLYSRRYFFPTATNTTGKGSSNPPKSLRSSTPSSSSGQYGPGAMAAVAICMLILGIAIGSGALFLYHKKKQRESTEYLNMTPQRGINNETYDNDNESIDTNE